MMRHHEGLGVGMTPEERDFCRRCNDRLHVESQEGLDFPPLWWWLAFLAVSFGPVLVVRWVL